MFWRRRNRDPKPEEIDRAWRRSLRAAVARDWPAAETWLERIVESDSRDLDAYHALARLYRDHGSVGRSIRMHQNLLLRPDLDRDARSEALLELARDFEAGGYRERAAASYEEVLAAEPRNAEVLAHLARLLHALQEYPRALALTRRLRRRDKANAISLEVSILLSQAQALREAGDHAGARGAVKRCLRRDGSCGLAWLLLGELEAERGRSSRALAAWKRGAERDAEVAAELYPKISAGYAAAGKAESFDAYLESILEDRPHDHAARIALARSRASRGDSKRAIEDLARAIEAAPSHLGLHAERGRMLLASGQDAEALKAYAALLEALERPAGAETSD